MGYQEKCQLAVCTCKVQVGDAYCSEYCRQAAAQGIPKDYCQCTHVACGKPARKLKAIHAVDLLSSISFAPGRVMIEYSTREDLREHLMLLAEAIQSQGHAHRQDGRVSS